METAKEQIGAIETKKVGPDIPSFRHGNLVPASALNMNASSLYMGSRTAHCSSHSPLVVHHVHCAMNHGGRNPTRTAGAHGDQSAVSGFENARTTHGDQPGPLGSVQEWRVDVRLSQEVVENYACVADDFARGFTQGMRDRCGIALLIHS
jgi:hypothetical protein